MKKVLLLVLFSSSIASAFAQKGSIKGTIIDKNSKETIIGANVKIDNTSLGAVTDVNGQFEINGIDTGISSITISYVSYKTLQLTDLEVIVDKIVQINIELEEDFCELGEVTVMAARETNTDIAIIADIRRSFQVVIGLSAEQISLSLDRDAAQVIKRVPGITVADNNFVQIRGLMSRYNPVMLHNAFAPSVEADVKSFNFNILPSSQLDRMLVFKSPSPDISGEFAGGLVKIFTKSIPEENQITFDYSTQMRQNTTFDTFKNQERSATHWTSFNNGQLDLPSEFPATLRSSALSREQLVAAGRSLVNTWEPETRTAGLDQRFGLTGAFKFNLGKHVKVGNITSLNYSNSYSNFAVSRADYNQEDANTGTRSIIFNYTDQRYTQSIRTGLVHNWAFRIKNKHLIEFKNLFNQNSISQYVDRTGINLEAQQFADLAFGSYDQVYRGIYTGQVLGTHSFKAESINSFFTGYPNGIFIDGISTVAHATAGELVLKNNVVAGVDNWGGNGFGSAGTVFSGAPADGKNHPNAPRGFRVAAGTASFSNGVYSISALEVDGKSAEAWFLENNQILDKWQDAGIDPSLFATSNPKTTPNAGSVLLTGAVFTGLPTFFTNVPFKGAFGTTNWAQGWVEWAPELKDYSKGL